MTTLHCFGDSWPDEIGEAEEIYEVNPELIELVDGKPPRSIPKMISDLLGVEYQNHSQSSTSQPEMIQQLVRAPVKAGDHAVFFITSPSRRFYFDEHGNTVNEFCDVNRNALNDYQDSWLSALTCYTLYNYCKSKSVTPWFLSTFNVSYYQTMDMHPLWDEIPKDRWIVDKHKCIVQEEFDNEFFSSTNDNEFEYRNSDWSDWLRTENENVKKYIRPCEDHPNLVGRMAIAKRIAETLRDKI